MLLRDILKVTLKLRFICDCLRYKAFTKDELNQNPQNFRGVQEDLKFSLTPFTEMEPWI